MRTLIRMLLCSCAALASLASVQAETKYESLHVYPPEIKLNTAAAYQNLVAVAVRSDGVTVM